jgi:hypothetical protein
MSFFFFFFSLLQVMVSQARGHITLPLPPFPPSLQYNYYTTTHLSNNSRKEEEEEDYFYVRREEKDCGGCWPI